MSFSLLAEYYQQLFTATKAYTAIIKRDYHEPEDCLAMLTLAVPYLSFMNVVFPNIPHYVGENEETTSGGGLSVGNDFPHENYFTALLTAQFMKLPFVYTNPAVVDKREGYGEPDILLHHHNDFTRIYVIELILASRDMTDHKEHLDRFSEKTGKKNYAQLWGQCKEMSTYNRQ